MYFIAKTRRNSPNALVGGRANRRLIEQRSLPFKGISQRLGASQARSFVGSLQSPAFLLIRLRSDMCATHVFWQCHVFYIYG